MSHSIALPGAEKARLVEQVRAAGLDGMLLTSAENVYYASGLPTLQGSGNPILFALKNQLPSFVYLAASGQVTLLCWIGATLGFDFPVDEVRCFFNQESALEELSDFLRSTLKPGATIGVESSCPLAVYRKIQKLFPPEAIIMTDKPLQSLRLSKTEGEIERVRKAIAIVEAVTADLRAHLKPGLSRLQLIQSAKRQMLEYGATGIGHTTIAFGTSNPEIAYDEVLRENQLVTLDLGAVVDGYTSDNRRLFYTGPIPTDMQELHATMCEIVNQVGQALKPGAAFADLYNVAGKVYTAYDLPPFFLTVGHSIGLQTEEVWISPDNATIVQPGMVLNIELYTAYQDGSNIGDEETFLVTNDGVVRLTSSDPAIQSV